MGKSLKSSSPQLLWHHRLHEEWAKERLYFWRLGFSPTYDRNSIVTGLESVFSDLQILSYGMYESTGQHDLFLRIWLPTTVTQDTFETTLYDRLSRENLQICEPFVVSNVVSHWIWNGGDDNIPEVSQEVLGRRLPDAEIERVNNGSLSEEELKRYSEQNLIRVWSPRDGIRIIILIPRPPHSLPVKARQALTVRLHSILSKAENLYDVSVYEGGGFAQFLMLATVNPQEFGHVNEVIDEINSVGLQTFFEVRTYTHVVVNSAGKQLPLRDRMPRSAEVISEEPIEAYLSRGESDDLEFKGSAFVDLKKWLHSGKLERNDKVTNEGALKAIVGFLNARGGILVLGVLESKKFTSEQAVERLEDFPSYGEYTVTGVNLDWDGHDIDWFQLRLQELIRDRIQPRPTSWLSVKMRSFENRDLCVITLRQVVSDDWFYLNDGGTSKFYVREGNSTRLLSGPDADEYKRANPR